MIQATELSQVTALLSAHLSHVSVPLAFSASATAIPLLPVASELLGARARCPTCLWVRGQL